MINRNKILHWSKVGLLLLPIVSFLIFITPSKAHEDATFWATWCIKIFENGFGKIYHWKVKIRDQESGINYPPLYFYILWMYNKLQGSRDSIVSNIYMLKYVTLLFEVGSTLILFYLLDKKYDRLYKSLFFSLLYLLNVAVLYNSLIWGQVDGIMTFFVFGAIISAYRKKVLISVILFILALNMKLQAVVFTPLWIGILLPIIIERKWRSVVPIVLCGILIQTLILFPFAKNGDLLKILSVLKATGGQYPVVSMNAYNVWYLVMKGNLMKVNDSTTYLGVTYKNWGLMMFFVSSSFALFYLVKANYDTIIKGQVAMVSLKIILISGGMIPLLFFFFNTEMHERYTHPSYIFIAAYSLLYGRLYIYMIGSLAYYLNLEEVLRFFKTDNYHASLYTPQIISCLYLVTIILLFYELYKDRLEIGTAASERNRFSI